MAKKATNFEVSQRVKEVVEFLLDGLSRYEIQEHARKEWDISRSPVDVLIRYANKRITRMAEISQEKSFDRIRLRLERQYKRSIEANEIRTSLIAIEAMRKLYGFDKPIKIAPTTPDGNNEYSGTPKETGFRIRKLLEAALTGDSKGSNGKLRLQDSLPK